MSQRLQSESSNQYKVNTYNYINYQDYGCTLNSNYEKNVKALHTNDTNRRTNFLIYYINKLT